MTRTVQLLALSIALFVASPLSAQHNRNHSNGNGMHGRGHTSHGNGHGYGHEGGNGNNGGGNHGGGNSVPELDPSSGASAFALLAGLALLASSRKRKA